MKQNEIRSKQNKGSKLIVLKMRLIYDRFFVLYSYEWNGLFNILEPKKYQSLSTSSQIELE